MLFYFYFYFIFIEKSISLSESVSSVTFSHRDLRERETVISDTNRQLIGDPESVRKIS